MYEWIELYAYESRCMHVWSHHCINVCIHADDDDADDADDDDDDDDGHDGRGGGDVRGDNDPDELDDGCLGALRQRQPLPRAALTIIIWEKYTRSNENYEFHIQNLRKPCLGW